MTRNYSANGIQSPGSTLQKQSSFRPPGASAPRTPGHSASPDPRDDASVSSPSLPDPYSPTNYASSPYFPHDSSSLSALSNIPPPPPLKPPSNAQAPVPLPKHALDRNSSDDILAPGTHGFARPLSHSKCPYPFFPGIYQIDQIIVLPLQSPVASTRYDPPAPSRPPRVPK